MALSWDVIHDAGIARANPRQQNGLANAPGSVELQTRLVPPDFLGYPDFHGTATSRFLEEKRSQAARVRSCFPGEAGSFVLERWVIGDASRGREDRDGYPAD